MVTFFSIFSVLVVINTLLFLVSFNHNSKKKEKSAKRISESTTVIFPLASIESKYKKAV
ncbi:hypothetical protein KCTC52924_02403 [Arenibacter antarcticus]